MSYSLYVPSPKQNALHRIHNIDLLNLTYLVLLKILVLSDINGLQIAIKFIGIKTTSTYSRNIKHPCQ